MTFRIEFDKNFAMIKDQNSSLSGHLLPRKEGHIELTQKAQTHAHEVDVRFNYEPLFFSHPKVDETWEVEFLGKLFSYPIWISSMTGGARAAKVINQNLARLAKNFNLGMGLGSCRPLLTSDEHLDDFNLRKIIGDRPLMGNLGIAQVEELVFRNKTGQIHELVKKLEASGLIIHLNPLQEWLQPEGDRFRVSPYETLSRFFEKVDYPVIVKEVGQGMGPRSLKGLLELPTYGIEFGAFGGTNFSMLESLRAGNLRSRAEFIHVGHTAYEMVEILNSLEIKNKSFIISGGMKSVLDGYELMQKLKANSLIGMASNFLAPAQESYEVLERYFLDFKESLMVARGTLDVKEN